jgi:flagellar hook-associated protein 1 FlgK
MAISNLLLTARDSLLAHRLAIDLTGGNVANVNTAGYTRQRLELKSVGTVNARGNTQIGVAISRVERIYDQYIESQVIEQKQNSSYSDTLLLGLQNIERMLDDTNGNGINDRLNKFWSSWETLSNNPTGKVERNDLLSAAKNLAEALNSYKRNLDTISTDMNRSITDTVSQINNKVEQIRDLNQKIVTTGNSQVESRNALLDDRSIALKELSSLINVSQLEKSDGSIDVYLPNGKPLVQGVTSQTLGVKPDVSGLLSTIYFTNEPNKSLGNTLTSGKLGAFIELQNTVIPKYSAYINDFTTALSSRVNELHTSGYDAYKNIGVDFFTITDLGNPSGTIGLNTILAADPNRIAASETVTGDGVIASKITAVQNELLMDSGTATLNSFLAATVGEIGSQVSDAKMESDYQTIITNQLNNQRESVSGVSIDEEMIQLIKYQTGYTAAGKLVISAEEMLDTLIGLIK